MTKIATFINGTEARDLVFGKSCDYCGKRVRDSSFQVIICYVIHWFCSHRCLVRWVKKEAEGK